MEAGSNGQQMNEQEEKQPDGREQDLSEYGKRRPSQAGDERPAQHGTGHAPDPDDRFGRFMRGCAIAAGIVVLIFSFVVGACFIGFSRW
jgi:hypothetical protein